MNVVVDGFIDNYLNYVLTLVLFCVSFYFGYNTIVDWVINYVNKIFKDKEVVNLFGLIVIVLVIVKFVDLIKGVANLIINRFNNYSDFGFIFIKNTILVLNY